MWGREGQGGAPPLVGERELEGGAPPSIGGAGRGARPMGESGGARPVGKGAAACVGGVCGE